MWHSQETAHDRPHTDSNGVLAWYWQSVNPNLTFPTPQLNSTQLNATQRSGAVGFLRVNPEEDVNCTRLRLDTTAHHYSVT
jgi:hypothetical protein